MVSTIERPRLSLPWPRDLIFDFQSHESIRLSRTGNRPIRASKKKKFRIFRARDLKKKINKYRFSNARFRPNDYKRIDVVRYSSSQ